jgi:hypothetical protein
LPHLPRRAVRYLGGGEDSRLDLGRKQHVLLVLPVAERAGQPAAPRPDRALGVGRQRVRVASGCGARRRMSATRWPSVMQVLVRLDTGRTDGDKGDTSLLQRHVHRRQVAVLVVLKGGAR